MDERRSTDLRPWTPDSLSRRQGIDWRAALTSRAVLLLQVAHPVVGAGVADHSEFLSDRWGRIRSTAASARRFSGLEGAQAAIDEGERLRRVHRDISGVDDLGRRYHALDADAYLWVAATGYWASAVVRRVHGRQLAPALEDTLYTEWIDQAGVLRIPDRVIPPDRDAFQRYFEATVTSVLERNRTTDLLIELDRRPMPPPAELRLPTWAWSIFAVPPAALLRLSTGGYLPPVLRVRLGIGWSPERARCFDRMVVVSNLLDRALPDKARYPLSGAGAAGLRH